MQEIIGHNRDRCILFSTATSARVVSENRLSDVGEFHFPQKVQMIPGLYWMMACSPTASTLGHGFIC